MSLSDPPNDLDQGDSSVGDRAIATTVRQLLDAVGAPMLHVLVAPSGLDHRISITVLHDPIDDLPAESDSLLLMSGIRADSPEAIELVGLAADRGYRAIVIKRRGAEVADLIAAASIRNVVVLAAADEVPWRHLDALLLSVLGSRVLASAEVSGAGDELFALANTIAAVVGGSVSIEDMDRRVIAYSSLADQRIDRIREEGILHRRVPEMERNFGEYREVLDAPGVVRFAEKPDEYARAAIAIRAGERPLGTIWAIEAIDGIGPDGERTLVEGSRLVALKMLRSMNASGLELQLRESALIRALDGSLGALDTRFRLSLPGGVDMSLVGFTTVPDASSQTPLISHVGSALARYIFAYRPDASVATTARAVYVLLPGGGSEGAERFARGALESTQESFPKRVSAALSYSSTDPADLPAMRNEVDGILRVPIAAEREPGVRRLRSVHAQVVLSEFSDLLVHVPRLRHTGLDAMVAWDRDRHTEYAASVLAWLEAVGDVGVAAARMGVHSNTMRYRLRRIGELFDVSLDEPDDRLSAWMQLRLTVA